MEDRVAGEAVPQADALRRSIRALTTAVWCLVGVLLILIAFYAYSYYRSWSFTREATSSSYSRTGADDKSFFDLPPEEKLRRATTILLTKRQQDGRKLKAVVAEILKQPSDAKPLWSIGDELPELSHYPQGGTTYGDGEVVLFVGSNRHLRESMTYTEGRVAAMGDMPLEILRELVKGAGPGSGRSVQPSSAANSIARVPATAAAQEGLIELEKHTNAEGVTRIFSIPKSAALRTPAWLPESGEPPLSMSRAVRLAAEAAQNQSPGHPPYLARAVRLQLISCDAPGDRWYYVMDCVPAASGGVDMARSIPIVVLMDGTVVPGRTAS
jgi:hypothetical protein